MVASEQASSLTDDAATLSKLLAELDSTRRQTKLFREYGKTHDQGNAITQGGFDDGHGGMESRIIGGGPYDWQCVSGRQPIQMADGSLKCAAQIEPGDTVLSWDQTNGRTTPGRVFSVARKPPERLVRVYFSTSETLEAAMDHRLLTTQGWRTVASCIQYKADEQHRRHAPSEHVLTSTKTRQDFLADCPTSRDSCDGRFRPAEAVARSPVPSQGDVQGYSHPTLRRDGRASIHEHIHDCRNTPDSRGSDHPVGATSQFQIDGTPEELSVWSSQSDRPSHADIYPDHAVVEVPLREVENQVSLACHSPCNDLAYITAYEILCPEPLYDFEVGEWHNYFAGGVVNHNCRWHNMGKKHDERMLMCANQVGKSRSGGAETACHAIGWYPQWWNGHRVRGPIDILVSGVTNEELRNICQRQLLGEIGEDREPSGTGWIPKERIGKVTYRQCGVPNVVDTVKVVSDFGGESTIIFKSYEQGAAKFQGVQFDVAWLDEEPESQDIFSEIQTRMLVRQGILMFTRTPLYGMTDMVRHFMEGGKGIGYVTAALSDAPHITDAMREKMLERWPEHERETRGSGKPMLGAGAVYPVPDEWIHCEPFSIPPHYRRLVGIDFGIDHPFVAVWIAYDADADVIYVTDMYEQKGATPPEHAAAIKSRGRWMPVSWPHDGAIRDKGSGVALAEQYRDHDLNMLHVSARYDDDRAGAQPTEPVLQDILERMRTGRFKVFNHLERWFAQKRMYHRKDGRIVRVNDDIMAATNYAVMMRRYAATPAEEDAMRQSRASFNHDVYDNFTSVARV